MSFVQKTSPGRVIDGRAIGTAIQERLKKELAALKGSPHLRILYFDTLASRVYWRAQEATAQRLGIGTGPSAAMGTSSGGRNHSGRVVTKG